MMAAATESYEFKCWFNDSKVVDDQGRPLVVYHGTGAVFSSFSDDSMQQGGVLGHGAYFTSNAQTASGFAERGAAVNCEYDWDLGELVDIPVGAANVMPVYLNMKNPYYVTSNTIPRDLQEQGYDGVVHKMGLNETYYVVFDPAQIATAIGTNYVLAHVPIGVVSELEPVLVGVVSDGMHSGQVLGVADGIVTQRTNRDGRTARHDLRALSKPVAVGDVVEIKYKGGVGVVSGKGLSPELGR